MKLPPLPTHPFTRGSPNITKLLAEYGAVCARLAAEAMQEECAKVCRRTREGTGNSYDFQRAANQAAEACAAAVMKIEVEQ